MQKRLGSIIWSQAAKGDALVIWHHIAKTASPEIADKVLHEIEYAINRVKHEPQMGRLRLDVLSVKGGLRSVLVHPYTIFYRISDQISDIQIVRVLHERRDFPNLLKDQP